MLSFLITSGHSLWLEKNNTVVVKVREESGVCKCVRSQWVSVKDAHPELILLFLLLRNDCPLE